jgi:transposase InsO family protein
MKYAFIQRNKLVWPISVQCRVLLVSVSGYHEHLARRVHIAPRRHLSDEALLVHISAVYAENRGAYGWPRISTPASTNRLPGTPVWRQLRTQGLRVGKLRVQRLMQKHGIQARGKRRFRVATTDSKHNLPIAPNVLDRNFTVAAPNQAWVGDFTYIATKGGWLFLAVVIDLFSRKVVGWSMRPDMQRDLVTRCSGDGLVSTKPRRKVRAALPQ